MVHRRLALPLAAALLAAVLVGCQGAESPTPPRSAAPAATQAGMAAPAVSAPTPAPASTADPAPTAAPTKAPSRYNAILIPAPALKANLLGERDQRNIHVYLPPSYQSSEKRYPVVYYLPGYTDTSMLGFILPGDADTLMKTGVIRDMIVVVADGANLLGGSFYVNSPVTGQWEDFIVKDVVGYVDGHYRTLARASARAIAGHSMGGFGALNIGMRHPDVFSVVYSLSPGLFDPNGLAESQMFDSEGKINPFVEYVQKVALLPPEDAQQAIARSPDDFTLAYGLAFAPNPQKQPSMDYPYAGPAGKLVRDDAAWSRWDAGFGGIPDKIRQYKDNLMQLKGLVVDYGRQDQYAWIPKGCVYWDQQLTAAGVPHELRAYDGSHESNLSERIGKFMLPFISDRLAFE